VYGSDLRGYVGVEAVSGISLGVVVIVVVVVGVEAG